MTNNLKQNSAHFALQPFSGLGPEQVIAALAQYGFDSDGRFLELNSYENRVYQVGCEAGWWVVKFYRPDRWSDAAILEEHHFTEELNLADLPVAVPMTAPIARESTTLFHLQDHPEHRFSVFPFMSARHIEIESDDHFEFLGRSLGRLHAVGALNRFQYRPFLTVQRLGWQARDAVLHSGVFERELTEPTLRDKYAEVSAALIEAIEGRLSAYPLESIRIHGDCHLGNVLSSRAGPVFVDLDDCMMGPRVQDLWMLLSGSPDEQRAQWERLLSGYEQFHHIDADEWHAIEALRGLRMLHFVGWVAARWRDPAFPQAFPWLTSIRYWQDYLSDLWLQCEQIDR